MTKNIMTNQKKEAGLIPADSYIRIYGFMRTDLGLEKTELLVYALIYSYFRSCESLSGTRDYICEWVGSCKSAVDKALEALLNKGYITKTARCVRGLHYSEYNINVEALPPSVEHMRMIKILNEDKRKCRNM